MVYRVKANPKMIKLVRTEAGLSLNELPKYLHNTELWEEGKLNPTWNDLRKLAKKYKRPPVFYLMSEPPKEESDDIIEFRSPEKIEEYSHKLRLEIRKAKYRRNAFLNISDEIGKTNPYFLDYVSQEKNPTKLAEKIRKILNISFETQQKWIKNENRKIKYDHSVFLYEWKEIFADLGILVFETEEIDKNEMSGMSIYFDECPIIILNGKTAHNRRIFTLMHELVHLIKKESSICDIDRHNQKEAFCNKVAAEILVPEKTLVDENIFFKNGNLKLGKLSHLYGVSKQTIVFKLYSAKKISNKQKENLIKEIEEKNLENEIKKAEANKKRKGGGMAPAMKKKKYEGKPYTRFILNAYENEIISSSKFMRYLDISVDEVNSLHEELFG